MWESIIASSVFKSQHISHHAQVNHNCIRKKKKTRSFKHPSKWIQINPSYTWHLWAPNPFGRSIRWKFHHSATLQEICGWRWVGDGGEASKMPSSIFKFDRLKSPCRLCFNWYLDIRNVYVVSIYNIICMHHVISYHIVSYHIMSYC